MGFQGNKHYAEAFQQASMHTTKKTELHSKKIIYTTNLYSFSLNFTLKNFLLYDEPFFLTMYL